MNHKSTKLFLFIFTLILIATSANAFTPPDDMVGHNIYNITSFDNIYGSNLCLNISGTRTCINTWDDINVSGAGDITAVTAGDGLIGGGVSGDVTVTMGTPGTLTGSTNNGASTTSHLHQVQKDSVGECTGSAICGAGHAHNASDLINGTTPLGVTVTEVQVLDLVHTTDTNRTDTEIFDIANNGSIIIDCQTQINFSGTVGSVGICDGNDGGGGSGGNSTEEMQDAVGSGFTAGLTYDDGAGTFFLNQTFTDLLYLGLTSEATTATALAANPNDCAANQFADAIVANGDLTCNAIIDADVPNDITIDLSTAATSLAANGGNCDAGSYPLGVDASGAVESCTDASTEIDSIVATHTAVDDAHHTATVDTFNTTQEMKDAVNNSGVYNFIGINVSLNVTSTGFVGLNNTGEIVKHEFWNGTCWVEKIITTSGTSLDVYC